MPPLSLCKTTSFKEFDRTSFEVEFAIENDLEDRIIECMQKTLYSEAHALVEKLPNPLLKPSRHKLIIIEQCKSLKTCVDRFFQDHQFSKIEPFIRELQNSTLEDHFREVLLNDLNYLSLHELSTALASEIINPEIKGNVQIKLIENFVNLEKFDLAIAEASKIELQTKQNHAFFTIIKELIFMRDVERAEQLIPHITNIRYLRTLSHQLVRFYSYENPFKAIDIILSQREEKFKHALLIETKENIFNFTGMDPELKVSSLTKINELLKAYVGMLF